MKTIRRFLAWLAAFARALRSAASRAKHGFRAPPIPPGHVCDDCRRDPATHVISRRHLVCSRCYNEITAW